MKKRLFALTLAALVFLCAACTPAAEVTPGPTPTPTATPTPTLTPEPTVEPSPAFTDLEAELYAAVEDYFDLKRDAVNVGELPAELADTYQGKDAAARAGAMRAHWEEWGVHIVSLETELKDFEVRWIGNGAFGVSAYEWTWVNYNGTGRDEPATDRMGWGYTHELLLRQNSKGAYYMVMDCSDEYEETHYKSELCVTRMQHDWSGSGYSYTSEALGIRVEFPPEWANYFDVVEEERVTTWKDENGNLLEPRTVTFLELYPKDFVLKWNDDTVLSLATIYFEPRGIHLADGLEDGYEIIMAETEKGTYRCYAWCMPQIELGPAGDQPDVTKEYVILETVQNGIQDGRWEIEVLEPKT